MLLGVRLRGLGLYMSFRRFEMGVRRVLGIWVLQVFMDATRV